MKILWFANTPCLSSEIIEPGIYTGGWLNSLEEQIVKIEGIELSICFYWHKKLDSFKHKKTTYYPVYRKKQKLRIFSVNRNEKEILDLVDVTKQVNPEIIHIHGTEDNFGLIQKYINIPTVISLQGIITPYTEKLFSGIPFLQAFLYEGIKPKLMGYSVRNTLRIMKSASNREQDIFKQAKVILGKTNWDRKITLKFSPQVKNNGNK